MSLRDIFKKEQPPMISPSSLDEIRAKVEKGFNVSESAFHESSISFKVEPKYSHDRSFDLVFKEFNDGTFYPVYRKTKDGLKIIVTPRRGKRWGITPAGHIILLILTAITVTWAGYEWWAVGNLVDSILFAVALMSILGMHELGHALTARNRDIESSLPFFIPAPPYIFPLGTFGAVILMGSPVTNRNSLVDVGIAGPLIGFFLSIPIAIVGLMYSEVIPLQAAIKEGGIIFTPSIMFNFLTSLVFGGLSQNAAVNIHPVAVAGWVGMFVTSLNLLPMGQLDGGHVIRGLMPTHYRKVYYLTALILLLIGIFWPGWIMWVILVYLMTRMDHPGPLNDVSELNLGRKLYGIVAIIILILCFTPLPIVPAELLK